MGGAGGAGGAGEDGGDGEDGGMEGIIRPQPKPLFLVERDCDNLALLSS